MVLDRYERTPQTRSERWAQLESGHAPLRSILLITRHYPPDAGALSYRLRHVADVLGRDHKVVVLASQPSRYRGMKPAPAQERQGALIVRRVWNGQVTASGGKLDRGLGEALGALWMTVVALISYRKVDVALVSSPPLFYLLPGWVLNKLCGVSLVVDIRDLWLDWAEEIGLIPSAGLTRLFRRFERSVLTSARHLTVATEGLRRGLMERYAVPGEKVTVVYNGVDDVVRPDCHAPGTQVEEQRLSRGSGTSKGSDAQRSLRVLYAGNLGPSQNLLGIAEGLRRSVDRWAGMEIHIVGDGVQWKALKEAETERLRVLSRVERAELNRLYASADAFLLHLAALRVYEHAVPSKIFEYAAYGKPVLCGVQGEGRALCARHTDCYYFDSDDPTSLEEALGRLMARAAPDNRNVPRADASELLRSARAHSGNRYSLSTTMPSRNELAVFDFDKTLVAADSFRLFSRMAAASGREHTYALLLAALCKAGLISNVAYKERVLQRLWYGRTADEQAKFLAGLYGQLERLAHGAVVRRMREHVDLGHQVVVLSASPALYVAPFVHQVWSDEIEVLASRFGHGEGGNLYGAQKAEVTRRLIEATLPRVVWVYTDHRSDLPLMEMAHHVGLVRPSAGLLRTLRARGIAFEIMVV
jgi:phosphoserine phosphatase